MPGIRSTMEMSDPPSSSAAAQDAPNRRKSGRAIHKPVLYQGDPNVSISTNGSAKRKRPEKTAVDAEDDLGDESSSGGNESDPDEEELKEKRRRAGKGKKTLNKPAAKKPKMTKDDPLKLAMRPATNGVKKPSKPRKPRAKVNVPAGEGGESNRLYSQCSALSFAWIMLTTSSRGFRG